MLFLAPNQQCKSTEGTATCDNAAFSLVHNNAVGNGKSYFPKAKDVAIFKPKQLRFRWHKNPHSWCQN